MAERQPQPIPAPRAQETWTADAAPAGARKNYWRDALRHVYPTLSTLEWLDPGAMHGRLASRAFAGGRASECRQGTVRLAGGDAETAAQGRGPYILTLQTHGTGQLSHAGRSFCRRPGQMTLMDGAWPFVEVCFDNPQTQIWNLPRQSLEPMLLTPHLSIGLGIDGRRGLGALLVSLLQTTWRELDDLDRPTQHRIQDSICRLVALAFNPDAIGQNAARDACRHASLPQACAYIEDRLQDPSLRVDDVAEWFHLSRRKLEMLFEEAEIGVAGWISRRRIEECRKMLVDPDCRHLSITEVAFTWGFGDLSTFNRRFRAQCGVTPREFRREIPAADPHPGPGCPEPEGGAAAR